MMKVDKAAVLKNRFWILLGVAVCMILTGMFFASSDDTKKKLEEITQTLKSTTSDLQGPLSIQARQKDVARAKELETEVWSNAYRVQEPIFTWPKKFEEEFNFRNGKFATAIKITALPADKKSWPEDTPTLIHGELANLARDWFEIKDRKDKPVKMYLTQYILDLDPKTRTLKVEDKDIKEKDITWDIGIEKIGKNKLFTVTFQEGKYFNDPLTYSEQEKLALHYKSQIHDILDIVDPVDTRGNGVVQLLNWSFDRTSDPNDGTFIRYVFMPWNPDINISDEAWAAQENLWIQKEIYQIIKSANDRISKFEGKGGEEKGKAYVYTNSYLELTLILDTNSNLSFKIKNLTPKRQSIDLKFEVKMNDIFDPEVIKISGKPLAPKGDANNDFVVQKFEPKKDGAPRKGIYSVEQLLNWETAAVKRIDKISIGSSFAGDNSHSHRTYPQNLRPLRLPPGVKEGGPIAAATPAAPALAAAAAPAKGVFANGLWPNRGDGQFPVMFQIPGGGAPFFSHGLNPNRYIEVSEQSRRIPVGIVLIVDQIHVDRVLTAFNNSRMRFLDTQVLLNLYPGSLQPIFGPRSGGAQADPEEAEPKYSLTSFTPGGPPKGPFGAGPTPPRPPGGGSGGLETNMEMVIYGIVTLYQRFPPRPAGAAGTDAMKK